VFLVSTLRQSGPTVQLFNIVRHLDRGEFDPVVVTLSAEPRDSMLGAFRELGARVESLSLTRTRSMLGGLRRRIERLVTFELDSGCVIHSQGIRPDVIAARELGGLTRVATVHNYPHDDYPLKYGPLMGRWMAHRHLQAFHSLPILVACSSTLADRLGEQGLGAAVIRNGVDTGTFNAVPPAKRARLRLELGLDDDSMVGISVGSMIPRKNPLSIVSAMKRIDSGRVAILFVGGGMLEAQARLHAATDHRILFSGHVGDVFRYMQAADFFVSASRAEGLPSAVLEALACGLPVVLSDIAPHREVLSLMPGAGELFRLEDDSALSAAIERAAASAHNERAPRAEQAAQLFGAEQISRGYQELYRRVLRTSAGGESSAR
jgi:glycosyltransferase involved in cell wall biosynthesis